MQPTAETRSERVDLRMTPAVKQMLQHAANMSNKTLTEFLIDQGMRAAVETMTDRRVFVLDDLQWRAFEEALTNPPLDNPGLDDLMARKPAWTR